MIRHETATVLVNGVLGRGATSFLIVTVILSQDSKVDGPQGRTAQVISSSAGAVVICQYTHNIKQSSSAASVV